MKLEVGKKYLTRSGRTAVPEFIRDWGSKYCKVIGYIEDPCGRAGYSWSDNGIWSGSAQDSQYDIVSEYREPKRVECCVSLYLDNDDESHAVLSCDGFHHAFAIPLSWVKVDEKRVVLEEKR